MRSRLVALILLPTVVGVLLGGIQLADAVNTSVEYRRLNEIAGLVQAVGALSHEAAMERDYTAWYAATGRRPARQAQVRNMQQATDKAKQAVIQKIEQLDSGHSARVRSRVDDIQRWIDGLPGLRKQFLSTSSPVPARAILGTYTSMIGSFTALGDELRTATGNDRMFGDGVALGAFTRAQEQLARQRGILTVGIAEKAFTKDDLSDFLGARQAQDSNFETFEKEASAENVKFYAQTVKGFPVEKSYSLRAGALAQMREYGRIVDLDTTRPGDDLRLWFETMTTTVDKMNAVEQRLAGSVVTQTQTLADDEQRLAIISGSAILLLLGLMLLITTAVAGSLTRPLRRLRREALEIAGSRLPRTVQMLRESQDDSIKVEVAPIQVTTRDEIGEVARAFDEVHQEAIRLAGDEARLRSNVNAMFVNLSRRTQTLVERQLALIDGLEQGEQDEGRLGNLFKLDHLATRMRRNSENLLVLAGQEPARRWGQPVPVVDVVRASLSEVENYERVSLQVAAGGAVVSQAVNDVVHLVAELVENAISFSPRETKVVVSSNRIDGGGLMISVSDLGIGMTADELAQANWRLANPPVVDVSVSRRMGLFVVGRLALRHGIRVQLRQQDAGGLTAMVLLPEALLAQAGGPAFPGMPPADPAAAQFGAAPALASPTPFDSAPRTPVIGSDAPGVGTPGADPFERGPFDTFGRDKEPFAKSAFGTGGPTEPEPSDAPARDPFDPPAAARNPFDPPATARNPFDPPPFERGADSDPFGKSPFGAGAAEPEPFARNPFDPPPFERGKATGAPVDTPWPGHLPAPGSSSWPTPPEDSGGWPAAPTRGAFEPDVDNTGPLPAIRNSPMEDQPEEFLPIFAAVESDWFKKVEPGTEETEKDSGKEFDTAEARQWSSPADAGWQAAKAASDPSLGGVTSSGLPKRVPKANLVPGSASAIASSGVSAAPAPPPPAPSLSPDRVRNRLSSFQQGIRQGRAVARGEASGDQGYPGATPTTGGGPDIDKEDA
ncbi:nitrate- and nitrite sensing domain-containing protein [Microtetraspora sp. NBRC 16547]|uniref:sensor histidine kinase n=1 Tax=Microtetraspora sp. NBRC 16547 TaxID=3030993 RepID=UPI002552A182|nr:nitrate- and nitrite sensing domain-containing protein [Microtetraspora sp. NBRC 16547]